MFTSRLTSKTTSDAATKRPASWVIVSESTSIMAGYHKTPEAALDARLGRDDTLNNTSTTWTETEESGVYQITKSSRYGKPLTWKVIVIRH